MSQGKSPGQPPRPLSMKRIVRVVAAPVERFLQMETASSILLLLAAATALIWANSPWHESYEHLWHTPLTLGIGEFTFTRSLHFWINELLMTVFFLVVGLEIKREIAEGELSEVRRAAFPVFAAIGGMVVPALIYFALNPGPPGRSGFGIPMATDIAFAVGVMGLLGKRVPSALRILLLAIAIIDDVGAILIIALFYSSNIDPVGLAIVGGGLLLLFGWGRLGFRPGPSYSIPLLVIWVGLLKTGVHPTLAGVIVGLSAPVRPWIERRKYLDVAREVLAEVDAKRTDLAEHDREVLAPLRRLAQAGREAVSPVVRLESAFHPWVAYLIMPLFALANAGVSLRSLDFGHTAAGMVMLGVALGLVVGKPLGIVGASWLSVRMGLCRLPRGVDWRGIWLVGVVAGIGFTMSIFIAELAFPNSSMLGVGKLFVLIGSTVAAVLGLAGGRFLLRPLTPEVAAITVEQAETSTDD